ncbi:MAG TPA: HTTM domain-containing protein [Polyangiaceae bacterium]|jgi:hypothetical protein
MSLEHEPTASRVHAFFAEERDAYLLGLLRVALGLLLFLNAGRLILELENGGYFADFFHLPIWPESLVPTRALYTALLGLESGAAVLVFLGVWSRGALLTSSCIGLFLLGCDRLQYHNNRYALLLLGFLLAFTPCDRSFLIAKPKLALPSAERIAPTFARKLFQIQVSLVYLSSACGKLFDSDWRGGQVLRLRFMSVAPFWATKGVHLPVFLEQFLASPLLGSVAAKVAISTELFIALELWFPRTRRAALWVGVMFHFWIEVSARVELFSYVMGASYLAFLTPELRERRCEYDPRDAHALGIAKLLRRLDWCARFEFHEVKAQAGEAAFRVVTRSGETRRGLAAYAELAAAVPLLFPTWPALALAAKGNPHKKNLSSA